jgi:hypothetical protein
MFSQQRFTIFFLFLGLLSTSVWALNPTPIQQFLQIPTYNHLMSKMWHIEDDIVGFYGLTEEGYVDTNKPEGYLRITPKTSQVQRILDDTIAFCHPNISLLDRSYYYASASTFLYYCVANNSLLLINTKDYTVQDAIPISTSQTFNEVILGRDEQGHVYILGLPDILYLPARAPTELILVNLTTKAIQNHIIFDQGSDSQKLVTGFAFDSGVSYLLTKGLQNDQTLIEISKINLNENDYELTPFTQFTYQKESIVHVVHNPLYVIDGFLFTNDYNNLLIFSQNGSLVLNETNLETHPWQKKIYTSEALWAPLVAAQEGGSIFYAYFLGFTARAYFVQDGVINSSVIDQGPSDMKVAVGHSDLMICVDINTFYIKDMQTNTTISTAIRQYDQIMVSSSYISFLSFESLYVFDRQVPGKLLQTLEVTYPRFYDPSTNVLFMLSPMHTFCQVTYLDLETLAVTHGPFVFNPIACSSRVVHFNITDPANPFWVVDISKLRNEFLLVSPKTYGEISWVAPGTYIKGLFISEDAGRSFSYVFPNSDNNGTVFSIVNSYELDDLGKNFVLQDSYNFTLQAKLGQLLSFLLADNMIVITHDKKVTIIDLAQKSVADYDVLVNYNSPSGLGVFYDKNKTPYLALSEVGQFGQATTLPQLFDFTNFSPMPGAVANQTRTVTVINPCSFALIDEFNDNIGVIKLFETCNSKHNSKIYI